MLFHFSCRRFRVPMTIINSLTPVPPPSYRGLHLVFHRIPSGKKEEGSTQFERMGAPALRPAHVFRHILKSIEKHIGTEDYKRHFKEFIAEEFQKNKELTDSSSIQRRLKLAQGYTLLLNSIHHHKELLFSYNIAVDRSDEMKKILGKSAASVGLQLPEVYQP